MLNTLMASTISEGQLRQVVQPLLDVCGTLIPILLAVVGALGAIFCIVLGVRYAKASDPQEHEKAKKGLKNAIIGFVIIFVLLVALQIAVSVMQNWWATYPYDAIV